RFPAARRRGRGRGRHAGSRARPWRAHAYGEGLSHYRARDFAAAAEQFARVAAEDPPSALLLARVRQFARAAWSAVKAGRRRNSVGDAPALLARALPYCHFPAASVTTLAHLSMSRCHIAPNLSAVTRIGRPPTSASRDPMRGSASPALISRFSVAMTAAGGPA